MRAAIVVMMSDERVPIEDASAPASVHALVFAALFLVSFAFLGASYCVARALIGGMGFSIVMMIQAFATALVTSVFLWWLAPLADLGEILCVHLPAQRRARQGRCPHCGYAHDETYDSARDSARDSAHACPTICSECGRDTTALAPWELAARPLKRMAWILVAALLAGAAVGEVWSLHDEANFRDEAAADSTRPLRRSRAFPASFVTMSVDAQQHYASEAWSAFTRDPHWKPTDPTRRERGWGWKQKADDADSIRK